MGYLHDFVTEKMQNDHDAKLQQVNAWHMLATDPRADDPTKQYAMEQMLGMHKEAGKHVKDGSGAGAIGGLMNRLGTLVGLKKKADPAGGLHDLTQQPAPSMASLPEIQGPESPEAIASGVPAAGGGSGFQPFQAPQTGPFRPHFLSSSDIAQRDADIEIQKYKAMTPAAVERATAEAKVRQAGEAPPTKELADGTIAQWDFDRKSWVPATVMGQQTQGTSTGTGTDLSVGADGTPTTPTTTGPTPTPMMGATKPPTIINGKDGRPIGIQRPTGAVMTTPDSMLPAEKQLFQAASDAYQADLDQDEAKRIEAEDRFNKAQAALEQRSIRSQEGLEDRFSRGQNQQLLMSLRDDYRADTTPYRQANDAYRTIQQMKPRLLSAGSNLSGDDIMLVYSLIKLADPAPNAVREGEVAMAQNTMTVPATWMNDLKRLFGISADIYSPASRKLLIDAADAAYNSRVKPQIDQFNNQYRQDAENAGVPFESLHPIQPGLIGGAPGGGGGTTPPPPRPGAVLDAATARQYLQRANGNAAQARQLATQDGWSVR